MDSHIQFYPVTCLEKVFPDEKPKELYQGCMFTGLKNEVICFQTALRFNKLKNELYIGPQRVRLKIKIETEINAKVSVRQVKNVPSNLPLPTEADENYLRTQPGLFPDRLCDLENGSFIVPLCQWTSLWFEVHTNEETASGFYPIKISLFDKDENLLAEISSGVTVIDAVLPKNELIFTQWFHSDCLADYYNVPVFGEEHWRIIENFVRTAVGMGINMILTPVITPPLDTSPDAMRTNVQLLDISVNNGKYSFGFDKLKRWLDLCNECGIEHFEICHLFSQWGSKSCPNVYASVDGEEKQIFSMKMPAEEEKYAEFLKAMLPALLEKLKEWNYLDRCYFHISDEPSLSSLNSYYSCKKIVEPYLKGLPIIDAMSDFQFYKNGTIEIPICATDRIKPFLEAKAPELWAYYCGGQGVGVSNRFFSMPSRRNRVIGIQLYRNSIKGFLHWGYNFYNSAYSKKHLNPYAVTDADFAFASGDSFSVYPGKGGIPEESIIGRVFLLGLQDYRALQLLGKLKGRKYAFDVLDDAVKQKADFEYQPETDEIMLEIRRKINDEIAKIIQH